MLGGITRMPEFCAPAHGNKDNTVTLDVDLPTHGAGVRYALGAVRAQNEDAACPRTPASCALA